jgi:hypothetical protein
MTHLHIYIYNYIYIDIYVVTPRSESLVAQVVYSFSGQWMYFELIDTMAEPKAWKWDASVQTGWEEMGRCTSQTPTTLW